jgi:hypothetical protein
MGTNEQQHFNLVRVSKSSWVAVHVSKQSADGNIYTREPQRGMLRNSTPQAGQMFAEASVTRAMFAERFPRLTIAVIAFALFAISATAEVELLRKAGYFWR